MDNRQGFPWLYDAHHALHLEDLPFWEQIVSRRAGPVLELGCGTGRVTLRLAQSGRQVTGLDRDAGMVSVLQAKTGRISPPIAPEYAPLVFLADMRSFRLAERFSAILLPCNTLSNFISAERKQIFGCIHDHLLPGGIFAASLPNPEALVSMPVRSTAQEEEIFYHPVDGEPVQVSVSWQRRKGRLQLTWHYDHLFPDGRVDRSSVMVSHSLDPWEQYVQEINEAGLELQEVYGDYDRSPYTSSADNLILVAGLN